VNADKKLLRLLGQALMLLDSVNSAATQYEYDLLIVARRMVEDRVYSHETNR